VLLLNAGAVHRVGSNRMYVTMARAWAARGFTVFRIDIAGIGDSRVADGARENVTYSTSAVSDVAAAMAHLRRTRGLARFVLGGLCSGAYVAFHAGLTDLPVAGSVMINPQTFYYKDGDPLDVSISRNYSEARHYRRALFHKEAWRKALRGDVSFKYIFDVMRTRAGIVAKAKLKLLSDRLTAGRRENLAYDLGAVVDRGIDTLFVFSGGDPGLAYLDLHARSALFRLRRRDNFRLEIIEGADHTFTPLWSQARLLKVITDHLVRRYA
jgi:pimeloyl-ACP methyl ester carboxylesterase